MKHAWLCATLLLLIGCDPGDVVRPGGDGGSVPPPASRSEPAAYVRGGLPGLVIELDAASGLGPRGGVEATVIDAIAPLLDKPTGIRVLPDTEIPPEMLRAEWTFEQLRSLADATFDEAGGSDEAVMHTLWLPGRYVTGGGGAVLGVAWGNRHIAIFPDSIESACSGLLPLMRERLCRDAEAGVWTHEIGHVIGLVNNGIPMVADHEDGTHEGHTTDESGVMYWAFESGSVGDLLAARAMATDGPLFEFGPASIADVAAFRDGR